VAVESFKEFNDLPDDVVQGKIIVFVPKWESYGKTVVYRRDSAKVAGKRGAVAALVRSITPFSLNSPHTGMQEYDETIRKIPVACLTVEDATTILRMYRRNETVKIHLEMEDRNLPAFTSRNTIGELQGRIYQNTSVVVVSGHLDSWDVGVGAMDDGGGALISWKAVEFLKAMNLRPKRTIRFVKQNVIRVFFKCLNFQSNSVDRRRTRTVGSERLPKTACSPRKRRIQLFL
jgi:carboxypeptidase Q